MEITPAQRRLALSVGALGVALAAAAILAPHGRTAPAAPKAAGTTPTTVMCGESISSTITVANDLSNCANTALTVTGSHIVVNLDGHTIDGTGNGSGLLVTGTGSTVENGSVDQFVTGVSVNAQSAHVQGMAVSNTSRGIDVIGDGNVVSGNLVASTSSAGIQIESGAHIQVMKNTARSDQTGIQVLAGGTTVSGNIALNNSGDGILVGGLAGITVTGNTANGNSSDGIATGSGATVTKNVADFNVALGIAADPLGGDGGSNKATGNGSARQCLNLVCSPS